jgi:uridine kinase
MNSIHTVVERSSAREDVRISLADGIVLSGKIGTSLEQFFREAENQGLLKFEAPFMAAVVDGKLRELSYKIQRDALVQPITLSDSDGSRIYRRSLVLLMASAIEELWPNTHVTVNYAVRDGGFYCELTDRAPFSPSELQTLDAKMREIIEEDNPISKKLVSLEEAREIFKRRGQEDKVRLLDYRARDSLALYTLRGHEDYNYGYMTPSTRYLSVYKLIHFGNAFVLQYPRSSTPDTLYELTIDDKLHAVFEEADEWLNKLKVEDIGRLNHLVHKDRIQELILVAEALHEQNAARISTEIYERHKQGVRIVVIAGPSSSGKTTFSKRLAIQLLAHGLRPFTLEMDNYFVDRDLTPVDELGQLDFESLHALNVISLNEHLLRLLAGERVQIPKFDFHLGKSAPHLWAQLTDKQIIIMEGIHGLNPDLLSRVPADSVYRIYVSVLSQLNMDNHNRIPTTDVRLLRRIVRDARTRGYTATDTLMRWQSVRRGEKRNIFPYQENADVMFNSGLAYELAALRPLAEPLLLQVAPNTLPHIEANRLLSFLRWVEALSPTQNAMIPDTSLLREFIGKSILEDYHPSREEEG